MVQAWLMDQNDSVSIIEPHKTEEILSLEDLAKLGITFIKFETENAEIDLEKYRLKNGYNYKDDVTISKGVMENYEYHIERFATEHLHPDKEVRYTVEGTGYFDVRDLQDRWVRMMMEKGMPSIQCQMPSRHRDYIRLIRLFTETPEWTPVLRPADDHPARRQYLSTYGQR